MSPKFALFALLATAAISTIECQQQLNGLAADPRFDATVSDELAKNVLQFAQEMGTAVLQTSDKTSEIFSPLSIYAALSMILLGANGQTYIELMRLLNLNSNSISRDSWKMHEQLGIMLDDLGLDQPNPLHRRMHTDWQVHRMAQRQMGGRHHGRNRSPDDPSEQQISIANGIFVQDGFSVRPEYADAIQSTYRSTFRTLDFGRNARLSTTSINDWVNQTTHGKIPQMFSTPLLPNTQVVIASALYFKAFWEKTFIEGGTMPREFYPDGLSQPPISVDMMSYGGVSPFYESKEYNCSIIALPYRRNLTTMYIIQPHDSNRQRLRELQAQLSADRIQEMIAKMEWRTSIIVFPKLHIVNELDLKEVLAPLGVRSLFSVVGSDLSLLASGAGNSSQQPGVSTKDNRFTANNYGQQFGAGNNRPSSAGNNNGQDELPQGDQPQLDEDILIFSRIGEEIAPAKAKMAQNRPRRSAVTYKATSSDFRSPIEPLRLKDLVNKKRITKSYPHKKSVGRGRRQADFFHFPDRSSGSLRRLQHLRGQLARQPEPNPGLFADDLKHKIDLTVNEVGTEGGAATTTVMRRTGPDVVFRAETPFLLLISHDDTKLPLFYGAVFRPTV